MRKLLLITMCFAIALMFSGVAYGMHDKGVARCSACHTMHNSQNGVPVDAAAGANSNLLIRATASDVCLTCHTTSQGAVFGSDMMNPPPERGAGNFVFLLEDKLNERGDLVLGEGAGHNIIAPSRGLNLPGDLKLPTAPGGTYRSEDMGCSSCHDPHGNTSFRLLYGAGHVHAGNANFTAPAPTAVGIYLGGLTGESNLNHTAYQGGMSAWCGNCHGNYHLESGTVNVHPSGSTLTDEVIGNYGRYSGTAKWYTGSSASSYLAAVPFEDPGMTTASTAGPTASSRVSCISCHRAHATSAPDAGRWDFGLTYLAKDGVLGVSGGGSPTGSGAYAIPNPYPDASPTVPVQRSLCNKCHAKDAYDEGAIP